MKTKKVILGILVGIVLGFTVASFVLSPKTQTKIETSKNPDIEKWYEVAENSKYKIFTGSARYASTSTTIVLDLEKNLLLVPNKSCEVKIPTELKQKETSYFYNDSVGIIKLGPYKSIFASQDGEEFVQKVQNAGCLAEEGRITLSTDETKGAVDCTIAIEYKHLGC
ncbi:MAG: hypothetical protein ACOZAO_05130 [Patescibacteria group bacterium]